MAIRFLALVLLTCVAYFPARHAGFVWDDEDYIVKNPYLRPVSGLAPIWLSPGATPQFYPMTFTTFWVEYHLWGLQPLGYHFVNVLLHGLNSGLLWLLLRRLEVPAAWLIAAIFAVHPVHAESVVWVSERKNVLSGAFYLSAFLAYLRFSPLQSAGRQRNGNWYLASLGLFLLALLSKTVTCSLPAVLVLVMWWKRGKLTAADLYPLVPMFIAGAAMASVTSWVEREHVGAQGPEWNLTPLDRCLIAGRAVCFYAGKLFWPHPLMFNYPRWHIDPTDPWQYLYPAAVLTVLLVLSVPLWFRSRDAVSRAESLPRLAEGIQLRHGTALRAGPPGTASDAVPPSGSNGLHPFGRGPLTAWLIFIGTLVPALGFVNTYPMKFAFVADHFQYLASIAVIALAVATVRHLIQFKGKTLMDACRLAALGGLVVLVWLTWKQCSIYHDPQSLWLDTANRNPDAYLAQFNLGTGYLTEGHVDQAVRCFQETERSLSERPDLAAQRPFAELYVNWGIALAQQGRADAALKKFEQALHVDTQNSAREAKFLWIRPELDGRTYFNMGRLLERDAGKKAAAQERYASAWRCFDEAVRQNPYNAAALQGAAEALMKLGRRAEAAACYRKLVDLDPTNPTFQQLAENAKPQGQ